MGLVLSQEETGVPEENMRCLVESKWATLLSHVIKLDTDSIETIHDI